MGEIENGWGWRQAFAEDWKANRRNSKGMFVVINFRLTNWASTQRVTSLWWLPSRLILLWYKLIVTWVLGVEINARATVGPGLQVFHGTGLVVNADSVIGRDVVIRQGTTIGNKIRGGGSPAIGDHVEIGANAIILGEISIGDYAKIGAGAVVLIDVPPYGRAVGNPARVLVSDDTLRAVE